MVSPLVNLFGCKQLVGYPHESHQKTFFRRKSIHYRLTKVTPGLAQLAFHPVATYGMAQSPFRHTNKQLYGFIAFLSLTQMPNKSEGESCL
jgi:hypothetical protein